MSLVSPFWKDSLFSSFTPSRLPHTNLQVVRIASFRILSNNGTLYCTTYAYGRASLHKHTL
jgi:hypothetical protein